LFPRKNKDIEKKEAQEKTKIVNKLKKSPPMRKSEKEVIKKAIEDREERKNFLMKNGPRKEICLPIKLVLNNCK
jgi:hypothetical protein